MYKKIANLAMGKKFWPRTAAILLCVLIAAQTLTLSPSRSMAEGPGPASPESDFLFDADAGAIKAYIGSDTDVVIPDTIGGVAVTAIQAQAFYGLQQSLASVVLPEGLVSIGDQAFQGNALTAVDIPASVLSIGAQAFFQNQIATLTFATSPEAADPQLSSLGTYAFRGNQLTSVALPASLTGLPDGAFQQNPGLSDINLDGLTSIGDFAFRGCAFDTVTLPPGLSSYGAGVFANNGKYVLVTGSPLASTYSIPGQFGEIAGAVRTLTVKYQDMNGNQLLADKVYTTDRAAQAASVADLVVDGNSVVVTLPAIAGCALAGESVVNIPINGDTEYIARYMKASDPPIITGLTGINVAVGDAVDLAAGVKAMDSAGADITSSIMVGDMPIAQAFIDTSVARGYNVKYSVTDSQGRTTTDYRSVSVGADPMQIEISLGWVYDDFTYSPDGTQVTGLSAAGQAKFDGGNTRVALPGKCPVAESGAVNVAITTIAAGTEVNEPSFTQKFTYISLKQMTSLKTIGDFAFGNKNQAAELDLSACSALNTIGDSAFYTAQFTTLDFSGCPALQTIGDRAFYSSKLTALDLRVCPSLKTIGNNAFWASPITSLDLSGHPALQTIGDYAFYSSQLASLNLRGCAALETIGTGAFSKAAITSLDLSGCKNLVSIGQSSFQNAALTSLDLSVLPALETIGGGAFYYSPLLSLDLSGCASLKTIESTAFYSSNLTSLDLGGCGNLVEINDKAFYSSKLTALGLGGCSALGTIGDSAFYNSLLTELDLGRNVALVTIGDSAFSFSNLEYLNIRGLPALETIGSTAFGNSKLTSLDLSGSKKLITIGNSAFSASKLISLDLSGCSALETIGSRAFYSANLVSVDFSDCVSLQSIGTYAFYASAFASLDMRACASLTTLNYGAFYSIVNNTKVYLPDSVKTLGSYRGTVGNIPYTTMGAFGVGFEKATWVYTNTSATSLADQNFNVGQNYETHIFVNKVGYRLDLKDGSGNNLLAGCPIVALPMSVIGNPSADIGRKATISPPPLMGYTTPGAQTLTLDGSNTQVVSFVYAKSTTWTANPLISVSVTNPSSNKYLIDATPGSNPEAQIMMAFTVSTNYGNLPANSEIVIPFYDNNIDMSTLRMGTTSAYITSWYTQNGELHLVLGNGLKGGDTCQSFPILFKFFNDGRVPYNTTATFDAFIVNGVTKAVVIRSNPSAPAKVVGYFDKGTLGLYIHNYYTFNQDAASRPVDLSDDTDVYFGWVVSYRNNTRNRNLESMEITYTIPTYVNKSGVTVRALFVPENNPGWVVCETDAKGVPTKVRLSVPYTDYTNTSTTTFRTGLNTPLALKLRFPGAQRNQRVDAAMNAIVTPAGMNAYEKADLQASIPKRNAGTAPAEALGVDLFYMTAANSFYIPDTKTPPTGSVIRVDKETSPMAVNPLTGAVYGDQHGEFYDNYDNTGRVFGWTLRLAVGPKYTATNAVLHDYNLDARMYYYGVSGLGKLQNKVEITAYGSSGNVLCREIPVDDTYIFTAGIRQNIKKVDIRFLDTFAQANTVQLLTKLYSENTTAAQAQTSGGVDFNNYVWGEFDATDKNTGATTHVTHNDPTYSYSYWKILHNTETMQATKTNAPTGVLFRGDSLTYTVGVSGTKMWNTAWSGFALLDVLPACVELVDARMTDAFASLPGAKVQVINNYNNSGLTGVLFTIPDPNKFTCPTTGADGAYTFSVGVLSVKIADKYDAGNFYNNVYAKVGNSVNLLNTVPAASSYNLNGSNPSSTAAVQNGYININELGLRKYIRNTGGDDTSWTSSGIVTTPGAGFEYKLSLSNFTVYALPDGVIYDIFPFVGDTYIEKQTPESPENIARGSQFGNTFAGSSGLKYPAGWTVYYTEAAPTNDRSFYNNPANWKTTYTNAANVTGIMFKANSGIMVPAMSGLDFVIGMKAPSDPSYVGARAYNSAAHIENSSVNPNASVLECNAVYNEIQQQGSVSLRKVGESGQALAGAVFQIRDASGMIVQTQTSGTDGTVTFANLLIGDYTIRELQAPAGYDPMAGVIRVSADSMIANAVYKVGDVENTLKPPPPQTQKTGSVTLTKNSVSGNILTGVQFRVIGMDAGINDNISVTKVTNTLGQVTFSDLPLGNYRIEEVWTSALGQLEANFAPQEFTLTTDGQAINLGTVLNNTAAVTLTKIALYSDVYQQLGNNELDAAMGMKLSGIAFALYDGAADVTEAHTAGGASPAMTNANGQITFTGLSLNKDYTLKELLTPTQQALYTPRGGGAANNEYTFKVDAKGSLVFGGKPYDKQNLVIGNNADNPEYTALLRKVDQDGNPLAGVEFEIYSDAAGYTEPKTLVTDRNGEILLTKSGLQALFGAGAPAKYFISEVKAPLGYSKSFGPGSVREINWDNPACFEEATFVNQEIKLNINKYTLVANTVYDTLQYLNMTGLLASYTWGATLADVSATDRVSVFNAARDAGLKLGLNAAGTQWELRLPLEGATFRVEQQTGAGAGSGFMATTGPDGSLPVPAGFEIDEDATYEVTEVSPPAGYYPNTVPASFCVAEYKLTKPGFDGNVNIDIDDRAMTGSLTVTKLDSYHGTILSNVGFELYDSNGVCIATLYTDQTGSAVFSNLPPGDYTLKEIYDSLSDFEEDDTEYPITIGAAAGQERQYITVTNDSKYSSLRITKIDGDGNPLPGIEFGLQVWDDESGDWSDYAGTTTIQPYRFTNAQGVLVFDGLRGGTYRVVELIDDPRFAAAVYDPGEEFTVSDDEKELVRVNVTNPNAEAPVIHKDVDGQARLLLGSADQGFTWNITATFGNLTDRWSQALITDPLETVLDFELNDITVKEVSGGEEVAVDSGTYEVSLDSGNVLTVKFEEIDGGYAYLSGKTYTISIPATIKDDATPTELAAYVAAGGIPNQAQLHFGDEGSDPIESETPLVVPPELPGDFRKDAMAAMYEPGGELGYEISYTIRGDAANYSAMTITDTYDPAQLAYRDGSASLTIGGKLIDPADYYVEVDNETGELTVTIGKGYGQNGYSESGAGGGVSGGDGSSDGSGGDSGGGEAIDGEGGGDGGSDGGGSEDNLPGGDGSGGGKDPAPGYDSGAGWSDGSYVGYDFSGDAGVVVVLTLKFDVADNAEGTIHNDADVTYDGLPGGNDDADVDSSDFTKDALAALYEPGGELGYDISFTLPKNVETYSVIKVSDTYDAEQLAYKDGSAALTIGDKLIDPADYYVHADNLTGELTVTIGKGYGKDGYNGGNGGAGDTGGGETGGSGNGNGSEDEIGETGDGESGNGEGSDGGSGAEGGYDFSGDVDAAVVLTLTFDVDENAEGTIHNDADVTYDGLPGGSDDADVEPSDLTKTADSLLYTVGGELGYDINFTLPKNVDKFNVIKVSDIYDANQLIYKDGSAALSIGGKLIDPADYYLKADNASGTLTVTIGKGYGQDGYNGGDGGAGNDDSYTGYDFSGDTDAVVVLTLRFDVTDNAAGTIHNDADMTYDGLPGGNDDADVEPSDFTKTADSQIYKQGEGFGYDISFTLPENISELNTITITDAYDPSQLAYRTGSAVVTVGSGASGEGGDASGSGYDALGGSQYTVIDDGNGVLAVTIENDSKNASSYDFTGASGKTLTLHIVFDVAENAEGTIHNHADVAYDGKPGGDGDEDVMQPVIDLDKEAEAPGTFRNIGDEVAFDISFTIPEDTSKYQSVTLYDAMPAGLSLKDASAKITASPFGGTPYTTIQDDVLTVFFSKAELDMYAGLVVEVHITATVNSDWKGGDITNTAELYYHVLGEEPPIPGEDEPDLTDDATVTPELPDDFSKDATTPFYEPGGELGYEISYTVRSDAAKYSAMTITDSYDSTKVSYKAGSAVLKIGDDVVDASRYTVNDDGAGTLTVTIMNSGAGSESGAVSGNDDGAGDDSGDSGYRGGENGSGGDGDARGYDFAVAAGKGLLLALTFNVDNEAAGTIHNAADLKYDEEEGDGDDGGNDDSDVDPSDFTKDALAVLYEPGGKLGYDISFTMPKNVDTYSVIKVSDTYDAAQLVYKDGSAALTIGDRLIDPADYYVYADNVTGELTVTIGKGYGQDGYNGGEGGGDGNSEGGYDFSGDADATVVLTLTFDVAEDAEGTIHNDADVTYDGLPGGSDDADVEPSDLTKTADSLLYTAGGTLGYDITFTLPKNVDKFNVIKVSDIYDANQLIYKDGSATLTIGGKLINPADYYLKADNAAGALTVTIGIGYGKDGYSEAGAGGGAGGSGSGEPENGEGSDDGSGVEGGGADNDDSYTGYNFSGDADAVVVLALRFDVTDNAAGTIHNDADVTYDGLPGGNDDADVEPSDFTKTADSQIYKQGEGLGYDISFTLPENIGDIDTIKITDAYDPSQIVYRPGSAVVTIGSAASGEGGAASGSGYDALGDGQYTVSDDGNGVLAVTIENDSENASSYDFADAGGKTLTLRLMFDVAEDAVGTIHNHADVAYDGKPGGDGDEDVMQPVIDLEKEAEAPGTFMNIGDEVAFDISFTIPEDTSKYQSITLYDAMPTGLSCKDASAKITASPFGGTPYTLISDDVLTVFFSKAELDMYAGLVVDVHITATVNSDWKGGDITNTAELYYHVIGEEPPIPGEDEPDLADDATVTPEVPDDFSKDAMAAAYEPGGELGYEISYTVRGDAAKYSAMTITDSYDPTKVGYKAGSAVLKIGDDVLDPGLYAINDNSAGTLTVTILNSGAGSGSGVGSGNDDGAGDDSGDSGYRGGESGSGGDYNARGYDFAVAAGKGLLLALTFNVDNEAAGTIHNDADLKYDEEEGDGDDGGNDDSDVDPSDFEKDALAALYEPGGELGYDISFTMPKNVDTYSVIKISDAYDAEQLAYKDGSAALTIGGKLIDPVDYYVHVDNATGELTVTIGKGYGSDGYNGGDGGAGDTGNGESGSGESGSGNGSDGGAGDTGNGESGSSESGNSEGSGGGSGVEGGWAGNGGGGYDFSGDVDAAVTLTLTFDVDENAEGTIHNDAYITYDGLPGGSDDADVEPSDLAKTADSLLYTVGGELGYDITFTLPKNVDKFNVIKVSDLYNANQLIYKDGSATLMIGGRLIDPADYYVHADNAAGTLTVTIGKGYGSDGYSETGAGGGEAGGGGSGNGSEDEIGETEGGEGSDGGSGVEGGGAGNDDSYTGYDFSGDADAAVVLTLRFDVTDNAEGTIHNDADVTYDGLPGGNDDADVEPSDFTKTADSQIYKQGEGLGYDISFTLPENIGDIDTITITDAYDPSQLAYRTGSAVVTVGSGASVEEQGAGDGDSGTSGEGGDASESGYDALGEEQGAGDGDSGASVEDSSDGSSAAADVLGEGQYTVSDDGNGVLTVTIENGNESMSGYDFADAGGKTLTLCLVFDVAEDAEGTIHNHAGVAYDGRPGGDGDEDVVQPVIDLDKEAEAPGTFRNIGDEVAFDISFTIPEDTSNYQSVTLYDAMPVGLSLKDANAKITASPFGGTPYTTIQDDILTVFFSKGELDMYAGLVVEIHITATVNSDWKGGDITNTAELYYHVIGEEPPIPGEDEPDLADDATVTPELPDDSETVVPRVSVEVDKDTIKLTSAAFDGSAADVATNEGGVIHNVGAEPEQYRYDINFRSMSNVDLDEFVIEDPLENVKQGLVRVEEFWTPAVWGDKDGRMNVWYKSTKAPVAGRGPAVPTGDGVVTKLPYAGQVFPTDVYSASNPEGWKLWTTIDQQALDARDGTDLWSMGVIESVNPGMPKDLANGDYITAIRLEFGPVSAGFTSKNYDSPQMNFSTASSTFGIIDHSTHNTNGSEKYYGNGVIENLDPLAAAGSKQPAPLVSALIAPFAAYAGEGGPLLAGRSAQGVDTPQKGQATDWSPAAGASDYAPGLAALSTVPGLSPLAPATYLVKATRPLDSAEIVSSAAGFAAVGGNTPSGLYDFDQDATLTRVIGSFVENPSNPNVGNIVQGNSFLERAKLQGLTLKNGVWYDSHGNAVKTGDAFALNMMIVMALASLICIALLIRTFIPAAGKRRRRKAGPTIFFSMLALVLAAPMASHATETESPSDTSGPGASGYYTMQVEYRYAEGEEPGIKQDISQYGRTYHLISQSEPVLESSLPVVRTYTYRIDGNLTPEQVAAIQGLGNIALTPVNVAYERSVDVEVVFPNPDRPQALLTNDVDDIPQTWPCKVTSGTAPGGFETKALERVGVTYQLANPKYDKRGLPAGYIATVIYRGTETYSRVGYYSAAATFTTSKADSETPVYIIVADYQSDEIPPQVSGFISVPPSQMGLDAAAGMADIPVSDGGNLIANLLGGNVPLGGTNLQGAWSLLSMIFSIVGIAMALIYAIGAAMKNRRSKMLSRLGMFDEDQLAQIKRRGTILRVLAVFFGVITLLAWLFMDNLDLRVAWIGSSTIMIGVLFAATIALCAITNVREKIRGAMT